MDMKNICVYSSSSEKLDKKYYNAAEELATEMFKKQYALVYGGGMVGTMGTMARTLRCLGGKIYGVIPERLNLKGVVFEECDELTVTPDMRSRKKAMEEKADAFIALPGGFGTFEELFEVITSKQLGYHNKPIVIINTDGYYDAMFTMIQKSFDEQFARQIYAKLYFVAKNASEAIDYLEHYEPLDLGSKWA